ncbi:hypothetical protein Clacol_003396 [Clathrus columnatus]|uniref:Fungal-type protein kinase domain-containing protein n=1 Tax=Clathrus columnatus TaxID=1419009 RepID=A0AAV5A8V9_9AGAM|nr:hypothetical protein Clacol_003396 [Clathrus columnatus]
MDRYTLTAQDQPDHEQYSSTFYDGRFDDMWWEVSRYVVGPMPVDDFLQRFLRQLMPNPTPLPPISFENLESLFEETTGESGPYTKFVNAVQPICSNFELRDVHSNPMHAFESLEIQPDLCVFNRGISDIDLSDPSKPEIMIILKAEADDPFNDNEEDVTLTEDDISNIEAYFVKETKAGRRTLGQITGYAAAQQAAQFRTHIFLVLVLSKHARLFRWDRSGVVVTERFPLCSQYFMEFFYLYNHATPHDSWRLDSQTPEHDVYHRLRTSNVSHIPTVVEGGDILDHETFTQGLLEEKLVWIRNPSRRLKKHRHYRLILKEIATPLHSFSSTKILVSAIRDAMEAHRAAYFSAGILHGDISSGNIMIYNNGGLLIDWDLSRSTGAQISERTGTWPFISCRLLKDLTASQGFIDDVESFVHVITWVSFRYAKHDLPDEAVLAFFALVFDYAWTGKDGLTRGGGTKMRYLNFPSQLIETEFENSILKELLLNITDTIAVKYRRAPSLKYAMDDVAFLNRYEEGLRTLENSEWIIKEFVLALETPNWPANDQARRSHNQPFVLDANLALPLEKEELQRC